MQNHSHGSFLLQSAAALSFTYLYTTPVHAGGIAIWTGDAWPRNFVYVVGLPIVYFLQTAVDRKKAGDQYGLWVLAALVNFAIFMALLTYFMSDTR
jgi:hypothetical protein